MSITPTSFRTAGLLLLWTVVERRPGRTWVAYGACAAIATTLVWAIVQRAAQDVVKVRQILDDPAAVHRVPSAETS